MKSLCIVKPIKPVAVTGLFGADQRVFSPDPKEAVRVPGVGGYSINMDFGGAVTLDAALFGYHTGSVSSSWAVNTLNDAQSAVTGTLIPPMPARSPGYGPPYHGFYRADAPLTSRFWQISFADPGPAFDVGVIALGLSWSSQWGQEMGAGRTIEDTSTVERLQSGGFGIDEGAIIGGYQWTFGDLQKDEIASLYRLVKSVGISRPILVVEDPEQTDGLNERIHWGLFGGLDAYERTDVANWRWALSVKDWA